MCTLGLGLGWTFSPLAASPGPIVPEDARRERAELCPAKADLTRPTLEGNKAWSLKRIRPQAERGTLRGWDKSWMTVYFQGDCEVFCEQYSVLVHEKNRHTGSMWREEVWPQAHWTSLKECGEGAKEAVEAVCTGRDSFCSLPEAPHYVIHKPFQNCEHRCSSHPQATGCIVYPVSWWSVQPQVNHNIHPRERLWSDGKAFITIAIQATTLSHNI